MTIYRQSYDLYLYLLNEQDHGDFGKKTMKIIIHGLIRKNILKKLRMINYLYLNNPSLVIKGAPILTFFEKS